MTELLIPVDPELAVMRELDASFVGTAFAGSRVGTKIPLDPKPTRFVRVIATGGGPGTLVTDRPTLTVEAFCVDETEARDLCALAVAILQRAARVGTLGGIPCHEVGVVSLPQNLPHPSVTSHFRFTATVSAALRRVAA